MSIQLKLSVFEKARAMMLIRYPFFAAMVLNTEWIADEKISTAATDMVKVWYNPKFFDTLPVNQAIFVMVHEIKHMVLFHGLRRGGRKPRRWNHAGDYAINQELVSSGMEMVTVSQEMLDSGYIKEQAVGDQFGLLEPTKYQGMTAEQIYDILEQDKKKGKGKGKPQPGGQGDDDDEDMGLDDLIDAATAGKTQAEVNAIKEDIKQKIAQAATLARAAGKMPANLALLVDGVLNPPQPWEIILREFMTRMVQTNETWTRRNRRFNVVLPSRQDVGMGELVIVGDTSASMMGDKIWNQLAGEINYCNEYVKPERTRVIWADYEACTSEEVFEEGQDILLNPKGGGGTDMRLPLKFVERYDPCCVILVTDCETPWPSEPTPYPLIVASTTNTRSPDWAGRLQLRENE